MGFKRQRFKDGVLIETIDTRVLSEEIDRLKKELNICLNICLSKSDWEITRAADPTSGAVISAETIVKRQAARDLHISIENSINSATELDDLEYIDTNIEDQLNG